MASDESSGDDDEDFEIIDEDDQTDLDPPVRYVAASNNTSHERSELDSSRVGEVKTGDILLVTHTKTIAPPPGAPDTVLPVLRLRCERGSALPGVGKPIGWVSANTTDGGTILVISEDDESDYYFALDNLPIRPEAVGGKVEKGAPTLKMGTVIEGLETVGDPAAKNVKDRVNCFVRYKEGWVQSMAKGGMGVKPVLEPFEFADKKGDAELQKGGATAAKRDASAAKFAIESEAEARAELAAYVEQLEELCSGLADQENREFHPLDPKISAALTEALGIVQAQNNALAKAKKDAAKAESNKAKKAKKDEQNALARNAAKKALRQYRKEIKALYDLCADMENDEFHPLDPKISAAVGQALEIVRDQTAKLPKDEAE